MRKITFFLFFFCLSVVVNGQVNTTDVVNVDSVTADKLFSRAKSFMAGAFKNSLEAVQLTDESAKTIVAKGLFKVKPHGLGSHRSDVTFLLTVSTKDGRYKYTFDNVVFHYQAGTLTPLYETALTESEAKGVTKKQWAAVKEQALEVIDRLVQDMKTNMATNNDW